MEIKQNTTTGAVEFVTYIGGDGYSAPIVLKSDGETQNYLYLHRDYQGSILAITDATGAVLEKRLFDAWGNVAKVQDGAGNTLNGLTILDRGYTGHEHLQSVGLIHMNGRLYDAKLHRFLQPDNYIQDPFNTQNYNRYGYVLNNPLKYIDPSGEQSDYPNNGYFPNENNGLSNTGQVATGGLLSSIKTFFDNPENGEWLRRNAGEIGRFVGRNADSAIRDIGHGFESAGQFIGRNIESAGRDIGNFFRGLFGGSRKHESRTVNIPQYQFSGPASNGMTNLQCATGGFVSQGDIHMPTQHTFLGVNMTALSEGNFFQQVIYVTANSLNIPVQYMMGRSVGDSSMRNLDGTPTSTDEGVMAFGTLPLMLSGGKGVSVLKSGIKVETGGLKQWIRTGPSYSVEGGFKTYSTRWGAGGNYWKKIENTRLQEINKLFRQTKLPGNNWRVKDTGHFHWWKN
jgi:RHS repeat-associated protein